MSRYKDFDAAIASLEPITVKLAGKEWEFPPEIPAPVVVAMLRRDLSADEEVGRNDIMDVWESLIGADRLQEMFNAGATWSQVEALSVYLMEEYGISDGDAEVSEGGEDGPPA